MIGHCCVPPPPIFPSLTSPLHLLPTLVVSPQSALKPPTKKWCPAPPPPSQHYNNLCLPSQMQSHIQLIHTQTDVCWVQVIRMMALRPRRTQKRKGEAILARQCVNHHGSPSLLEINRHFLFPLVSFHFSLSLNLILFHCLKWITVLEHLEDYIDNIYDKLCTIDLSALSDTYISENLVLF